MFTITNVSIIGSLGLELATFNANKIKTDSQDSFAESVANLCQNYLGKLCTLQIEYDIYGESGEIQIPILTTIKGTYFRACQMFAEIK